MILAQEGTFGHEVAYCKYVEDTTIFEGQCNDVNKD